MRKRPSIVLFAGLLATLILAILYIIQNRAEYNDIVNAIWTIAACFYFAAGYYLLSLNVNWSLIVSSVRFKLIAVLIIVILTVTVAYNLVFPLNEQFILLLIFEIGIGLTAIRGVITDVEKSMSKKSQNP